MSALSPILRKAEGGRLMFRCPGCNSNHQVQVEGDGPGPRWTWNGDAERPTFSPSLLIRQGHHVPGHTAAGHDCWCTFEARFGRKPPVECTICHSFVRGGQIEFLSDCTHALAGKTVPIPAWEREDAT